MNSRLFQIFYVFYEFFCPASNPDYIDKANRNLYCGIKKHCGLDKNSPIFHHLGQCNWYQYTLPLHSFPSDGDVTLAGLDRLERIRATVTNHVRIIAKAENCSELYFLESLNIKWKNSSQNTGTKELVLFHKFERHVVSVYTSNYLYFEWFNYLFNGHFNLTCFICTFSR